MNKRFFIILMILFVYASDQSLSAKQPNNSHQTKCKKKHKKKKCQKQDGLALQISLLRNQIESLDNSTSEENQKQITLWLENLEVRVASKLQQTQEKLENKKAQFNQTADQVAEVANAEAGEDEDADEENISNTERTADKIASYENRISLLQEALKTIDQLKMKLMEKSQSK